MVVEAPFWSPGVPFWHPGAPFGHPWGTILVVRGPPGPPNGAPWATQWGALGFRALTRTAVC